MKIYLYNLAIDTTNDLFHINNSVDEKLNLIHKALEEISTELEKAEYNDTKNNEIRAIFVAPEYFFAKSHPEYYLWDEKTIPTDRKGRHYEYENYETIRLGLTRLSVKFPKILLVPGTVAWKKPIVLKMADPIPGTDKFAPVPSWLPGYRKNREKYFEWMEAIGETPTEASWRDYTNEAPDRQILAADRLLRQDSGELYGGGGLNVQDKRFIFGERSVDPEQYIQELQQLSFGLAYNTAFFYLNGKKVGEYSKHSDYQEVLFADAYKELSVALLSDESSVLEIGGLTFGVEICLDHDCDVLKTYLSRSKVTFTSAVYGNDLNLGEYYSEKWAEHRNEVLKNSTDAYYRYRNHDRGSSIDNLYYFSQNNKPLLIQDIEIINYFDDFFGVTYHDGATLRVKGQIEAAGGGIYREILTQQRSVDLFDSLKISTLRDFKPNIHLVLSACVATKDSQGDLFIHSSSEKKFNDPNTNPIQTTYGYTFSEQLEIVILPPTSNNILMTLSEEEQDEPEEEILQKKSRAFPKPQPSATSTPSNFFNSKEDNVPNISEQTETQPLLQGQQNQNNVNTSKKCGCCTLI